MIEKTMLDRLLQRFKNGTMTVHYWDGTRTNYGTGNPKVTLRFKSPKVVRAMFKDFSLGVGEAYMDGTLEIEPLDALFQVSSSNLSSWAELTHKFKFVYRTQRNLKHVQPKQIQHHYDLGNDFYKLWLDNDTMAYTCAYYKTPQDTLEQAQSQKFDHVLRKLQLKPAHEILEFGCGWGHLLVRAAKNYGVSGLGVTLSREQHKYAQDLAKREKVDNKVSFELLNYQDVVKYKKQYDRVYSVGILEHVGRGNHATYFEVVDKMLKPKGISLLHSITTQSEQSTDSWIDKYIFPDGYLPTIRELTAHLPNHKFRLLDYENLRPHYALTLDEWWRRFEQHKDTVIDMFDERFYRMWRFWLAASSAGFRYDSLDLSQFVFTKGINNDLPLTRDFLYK